MPIAAASRPEPAPASGAVRRLGPRSAAVVGATSLAVAALTYTALPSPLFTAAAVVRAEGGSAAQRPALIQAALDATASRPVMARAAGSLAATRRAGRAGQSLSAVAPARSAESLAAAVRAEAGRVPGTLVVRAGDVDADKAAGIATAVAAALVAELDDAGQTARRDEGTFDARRLADLRQAAAAAHARVVALRGDAADLGSARTVAATRVETLRGRLDAIRAILAAGDPPLGTGRDVPPAIEALQASYLDLARRLATARETLGDRHTTIIGLRDGLERTAAELSAAWRRLARTTEAELAEATTRATQAEHGDAGHDGALDAARREAQAADAALARAEAPADGEDVARFRLIAAAPVPAVAEGLSAPTRLGIAALAGLAALAAGLGLRRRRADGSRQEPAETLPAPAEPLVTMPPEPRLFDDAAAPVAEPDHDAPRMPEPMAEHDDPRLDASDEETGSMEDAKTARADLTLALAGALPAITAIAARAEIPVVMVATSEAGLGTMDAVLALGEAAAGAGRRVLVVEGGRARPALAAAVHLEAEPALVDVFGTMRIVLRADTGDGLVYLAPSFRDGARLAADLQRSGEAMVADALADEFDLVVIDGDRASDASPMAAAVDAVLRVGRFVSARDDEHFLTTLGVPRAAFLGTLVAAAGIFAPPPPERRQEIPAPRPAPWRLPQPGIRRPLQADVRRRVGLR